MYWIRFALILDALAILVGDILLRNEWITFVCMGAVMALIVIAAIADRLINYRHSWPWLSVEESLWPWRLPSRSLKERIKEAVARPWVWFPRVLPGKSIWTDDDEVVRFQRERMQLALGAVTAFAIVFARIVVDGLQKFIW